MSDYNVVLKNYSENLEAESVINIYQQINNFRDTTYFPLRKNIFILLENSHQVLYMTQLSHLFL